MTPIEAVLFDLDGTLLDTAPDLFHALNRVRKDEGLPAMPFKTCRSLISLGSKIMIKMALEIDESHPHFNHFREKFLDFYHQNIAEKTQFFPEIENVLTYLERAEMPWGIE